MYVCKYGNVHATLPCVRRTVIVRENANRLNLRDRILLLLLSNTRSNTHSTPVWYTKHYILSSRTIDRNISVRYCLSVHDVLSILHV